MKIFSLKVCLVLALGSAISSHAMSIKRDVVGLLGDKVGEQIFESSKNIVPGVAVVAQNVGQVFVSAKSLRNKNKVNLAETGNDVNQKTPMKKAVEVEEPKKVEEPKAQNVVEKVSGLNYVEKNLELNDKYADKFSKVYDILKREEDIKNANPVGLSGDVGDQIFESSENRVDGVAVISQNVGQVFVSNKVISKTGEKKVENTLDFYILKEEPKVENAFKINQNEFDQLVKGLEKLSSNVSEKGKEEKKVEKRQAAAVAMDGSKFTDKYLKLNDKYAEKYMKTKEGKKVEKRQVAGAMDGSKFTDKYLKLNDKYAEKYMKTKEGKKVEKRLSSHVSKEEKKVEKREVAAVAMDGSKFTDKYLKLNDKCAEKYMKPM